MKANPKFREVSVEAVKILPDGTRIPLGIIAYYHKNPLKRWWYYLIRNLRNWRK